MYLAPIPYPQAAAIEFLARGNPEDFDVPAGSPMATVGNSVDAGCAMDGFMEQMRYRLYAPPGYRKAIASTLINETYELFDFSHYQFEKLQQLFPRPAAIIWGGHENDTSQGKGFENMKEGATRVFLWCRAMGIKIFIRRKIHGWGEGNSTKTIRAAQMNAWYDTLVGDDVKILDDDLIYRTAGLGRAPGDGHPSTRGGDVYGDILADDAIPGITGLNDLLPSGAGAMPHNQNVNPFWAMSGNSGSILAGGAGALAAGHSFTANLGFNVALETNAFPDGAPSQRMTINGTPAANGQVKLFVNAVAADFRIGETIEWVVRVRMRSSGGGDPEGLYRVSLNDNSYNDAAAFGQLYQIASEGNPDQNLVGRDTVLRTKPVRLASSLYTPKLQVMFDMATRPCDAIIDVQIFCRRVPEDYNNFEILLAPLPIAVQGEDVVITARRMRTIGPATVNFSADFGLGPVDGVINFLDGSITGSAIVAVPEGVGVDVAYDVALSAPSAPYRVDDEGTQTGVVQAAPTDYRILDLLFRGANNTNGTQDTSPTGKVVTFGSAAKIMTTIDPLGRYYAPGLANGNGTGQITQPDHPDWSFTTEATIIVTGLRTTMALPAATSQGILAQWGGSAQKAFRLSITAAGKIAFTISNDGNNDAYSLTSTTSIVTDVDFPEIRITREFVSGTTYIWRMWIGGVQEATISSGITPRSSTAGLRIGGDSINTNNLKGYITQIVMEKGIARHP